MNHKAGLAARPAGAVRDFERFAQKAKGAALARVKGAALRVLAPPASRVPPKKSQATSATLDACYPAFATWQGCIDMQPIENLKAQQKTGFLPVFKKEYRRVCPAWGGGQGALAAFRKGSNAP